MSGSSASRCPAARRAMSSRSGTSIGGGLDHDCTPLPQPYQDLLAVGLLDLDQQARTRLLQVLQAHAAAEPLPQVALVAVRAARGVLVLVALGCVVGLLRQPHRDADAHQLLVVR